MAWSSLMTMMMILIIILITNNKRKWYSQSPTRNLAHWLHFVFSFFEARPNSLMQRAAYNVFFSIMQDIRFYKTPTCPLLWICAWKMRPSCAEHQTFQNPRKVKFLCPGSRHQNSVAPYLPECYIKFIVGFLVLVIEATYPKSCNVIILTHS